MVIGDPLTWCPANMTDTCIHELHFNSVCLFRLFPLSAGADPNYRNICILYQILAPFLVWELFLDVDNPLDGSQGQEM